MNNGVTILASKAAINGNTLTINDPQIVNGLQTSTQISIFFNGTNKEDTRHVMLKVISADEDEVRDRIIKATNSQNAVAPATLRATDKVQRDIEANLKTVGLFYDRRKNFYKNEGKPASKIVSIPLMAQSLMTVLLARPNDARARPSSLIKDNVVYKQLFSEETPISVYAFCGSAIKIIEDKLREYPDLDARDRNNIRFYVLSYVSWTLTGRYDPNISDVSKLTSASVTDAIVERSISLVKDHYRDLGGTDQVAKGTALKTKLQLVFSGVIETESHQEENARL